MPADKTSHDEMQSQIESLAFLMQTRIQVHDENQQLLYDSGSPQEFDVSLGSMAPMLALATNGAGSAGAIRLIAINVNSNGNLPSPGQLPPLDARTPGEAPAGDAKNVIFYRRVRGAGSPFGFDVNAETVSPNVRSNLRAKQRVMDPKSGALLGTVTLSEGPAYGRSIMASVAWGWALASAVAVLFAIGVGWFISRRISAPVLALTAATTRMAHGELSSRAAITGRDEFGTLAHSFNEMADQVESTVAALRRFVSDAAHELHTPLTALRADLDLAAETGAAQVFIKRSQAVVKRMEALTNDLLDLSRVEAKVIQPPVAPVDLTALMQQNGEALASQAEQVDLALELVLPQTPVLVHADPAQIQRAVNNLVDNACKFTPAGGTIKIELQRDGAQAALSVTDGGIGIPPEDLPQLFNRFHRGRNATAYPGSGLGLAIVKAIVEQQGGCVTAENTSPGARFTLRWPIAN
jgi:signal transduction histidine kinase